MEILIKETYRRERLHISVDLLILNHRLFLYIQDDSGRNVNILGGDSTCHCERKISCGHGRNSVRLLRYSRLNLPIQKSIVSGSLKNKLFNVYLILNLI
jgi:hypothetical protein